MRLDRLYKDYWRSGIVQAPIAAALAPRTFAQTPVVWLPERGGEAYTADPFGLWRDDRLTVFVEHYDHVVRHGVIAAYHYDQALQLIEMREILREAWHLSYPHVFEDGGETYMLPEQSRGGRTILYRAESYPWVWRQAAVLIDAPLVDATPFRHEGRWWILAAPRGRREADTLLAFYADALTGPWTAHAANPLLVDRGRARPAGTVFHVDGVLHLPTMDCRGTYGKSVCISRLDLLTPDRFHATPLTSLTADLWPGPHQHGLHTLSSAGPDHTLIDVKLRVLDPIGGIMRTFSRFR